jgi:PhnB protein
MNTIVHMNRSANSNAVYFAPHLTLRNVQAAMDFYQRALGAVELRRWSNPDGSVHVAEMEIHGALFHMHEEVVRTGELAPETLGGVTSVIGVFASDPDAIFERAIAAGGQVERPMQDYDYGYRQGHWRDPFGHIWLFQKRIESKA